MLSLKVQPRTVTGKKTKSLRKQDLIPGVVYGHGFKSQSIQVPYLEFEKVYKAAGESSLIDLEIKKEKPIKSLIYDIQYHPLTDKIIHVDFYKIKAGEKITVEVDIKLIGVSPAVKALGGILVSNLSKVEIECLPEDLIHEIEVDISDLIAFADAIRVSNLDVPKSVKILQDPDDVVVHVEELKQVEEVAEEVPAEAPEEVEEVSKEEEKKEEEVDKKEQAEKGEAK